MVVEDKHKFWLIAGISIAILAVAVLFLYPVLKGPVFGKAIAVEEILLDYRFAAAAVGGIVEDSSLYNNDGSLQGGVSYCSATGTIYNDGAYCFRGGEIQANNAPRDLGLPGQSYSVEAWFNPLSFSSSSLLLGKGTSSTTHSFYCSTNNQGVVSCSIRSRGNHYFSVSANKHAGLSTWNHLVFVVDRVSNLIKIYLNGQFENQVDISAMPASDSLDSGGTPTTLGSNFLGDMDQARIYARILTDAEIAQLAQSPGINCLNGIQDGLETGVDCGGSCIAACEILPTVEICNNNIDDDEDTSVDCSDGDCRNDAACIIVPATCGNGVVDSSEECDGTNLNGQTCVSQGGPASGAISCSLACQFDLSDCGILAADEICADNVDNDHDGTTDCADSTCQEITSCVASLADADGDGVPDVEDLCPNTVPQIGFESVSYGCAVPSVDSDADDIGDSSDNCPLVDNTLHGIASSSTGVVWDGGDNAVDGITYTAELLSITSTTAQFSVNGESTSVLPIGGRYRLTDGATLGLVEVAYNPLVQPTTPLTAIIFLGQRDSDNDGVGDACPISADVCGDSIIGSSEACDDGNNINGDGCSSVCAVEAGYVCSGQPSSCGRDSDGDGIPDTADYCPNTPAETIVYTTYPNAVLYGCYDTSPTLGSDSDNLQDRFDNCPLLANAQVTSSEPEFTQNYGSVYTIKPHAVDQHNFNFEITKISDGSVQFLTIALGQFVTIPGSNGVEIGVLDIRYPSPAVYYFIGQEDADGDHIGDVCDAGVVLSCGDSMIEGAEACDDGNAVSADGCSSSCVVESELGYTCTGQPSDCSLVADIDGDGILNTEDPDLDGDGIVNILDPDTDGDGALNTADPDADNDGILDPGDTTSTGIGDYNDYDGDGISNDQDLDMDGDGAANNADPDTDGDGVLNTVDPDDDNDGLDDGSDNCQFEANPAQADYNNNGIGDACETASIVSGGLLGDVDGDNEISIFDALLTLQESAGIDFNPSTSARDGLSADQLQRANVDACSSGGEPLNSYDALLILQYSSGLVSAFPC